MPDVTRSDIAAITQTIAAARTTLDGLISELGPHVWSGPDADRFRDRWSSEVSAQLLSFERASGNLSITTYQG